jgi:hypothetical protein
VGAPVCHRSRKLLVAPCALPPHHANPLLVGEDNLAFATVRSPVVQVHTPQLGSPLQASQLPVRAAPLLSDSAGCEEGTQG